MVFADFLDDITRPLEVRHDASQLPQGVRRLKIDFSSRVTPDPGFNSEALTTLLRSASTKFLQATIKGVDDPLSPEDLDLLTTAISNSESLVIDEWYGEVGYSCLGSCLSQADGIKEINIQVSSNELSNNQAGIFFEAIKTSSCIESLRLSSLFEDSRYAGNALLEALQINRSLKSLSIYNLVFESETMLPDIFQVAISGTRVQSLSIAVDEDFPFRHVPWNVWTNVLCRQDCSATKIHLADGIEVLGPEEDDPAVPRNFAQRNTSVTDFTYMGTDFDMTRIMLICSVFQSLVSLNIKFNGISDLSPLDPLLIGEHGLILRNLDLVGNSSISPEHLSDFFRKLPQMTCIRHLDFRSNSQLTESDEWMDVLEDNIWRNESLERLLLDDHRHRYCDYYSRIDVALALNRGGKPRVRALTENMLPLVLERATKLSYLRSNHWNRRRSVKEDVVFGLLQEMVSFSLLGR